ncbi:MOSC domain-containing protein [Antarctobacter jejuensis]|uniref:MOSC domain-containing protein n=1 Tax=Antarctobacter jejuensis TaxID=1439938 RepID=UPI003FD5503C
MTPLAELRRSFAGPGRLDWIGLRPDRKGDVLQVASAEVTEAGLAGDHGRPGNRAVTIIQAEHLPVIAQLSRDAPVTPEVLRRNLVISGINLTALREFGLRVGPVRLQVTSPCAPCSRMEAALGRGGYNALRGHGGWCCSVVVGGVLSVGAEVWPDI